MLRIDHCVVHINANTTQLTTFKQQAARQSIPFNPARGKGTRGFHTADLFVGEQYWELVWLKRADGGGWRPDWIARYNKGQRGVVCIMLLTDQLDKMRATWHQQGLPTQDPERISFSLFGLRKTLPWRNLYLDPIPGTDLQIGLQEMDNERVLRQMQASMKPNTASCGITGFQRITLQHSFSEEAWVFLQQAFPQAKPDQNTLRVQLDEPMELCFERTVAANQPLQVVVQAITTANAPLQEPLSLENICLTHL